MAPKTTKAAAVCFIRKARPNRRPLNSTVHHPGVARFLNWSQLPPSTKSTTKWVACAARLNREGLKERTAKVALFVHGLMCTESVWDAPGGADYGALLAKDAGYTPLYVRYNSGLAIADSGAALAALLEALVDVYPGELREILPVGFSMGGLVVRSACHTTRTSPKHQLYRPIPRL